MLFGTATQLYILVGGNMIQSYENNGLTYLTVERYEREAAKLGQWRKFQKLVAVKRGENRSNFTLTFAERGL